MKTLLLLINLVIITTQTTIANNYPELKIVRGNHNYPPYEMVDSEGKLTGIYIDLIYAVAHQLDYRITVLSLPWKRALHLTKTGEADAITYIAKNKERGRWAWFIKENILSTAHNRFFVLKSNLGKFQFNGDFRQLEGATIGTIFGYTYGTKFDTASYLHVDAGAKNEEALIKKLVFERFDIGLADINIIQYFAKQLNYTDQIVFLNPSLPTHPSYIAFSKARNNYRFVKQFAKTMRQFKMSQAYRDILVKYGINQIN